MPNRCLLVVALLLTAVADRAWSQAAGELPTAAPPSADVSTAESDGDPGETPEIVIVTGRQPGPPLWRVINGGNVLYIFPTLSPVPEKMEWDSARVERVLAQSQEALLEPDVTAAFSPRILFNPINIFRGMRLVNRLTANPDDVTLDAVLPPDLYARYRALKLRYFPRDDEPEEMRPVFAGAMLSERILREEGLDTGGSIEKELKRLIRRTDAIVETEISVTADFTGSFKEVAARAEAFVASLSPEQERECFTQEIARIETDLEDMKSRANAWAQGRIDQFRGIPLPGDVNDACEAMLFDSSEFATLDQLTTELDRRWLEAAERALAANTSTFAILDIVELLGEDGLLADLRARGYEIIEP
jgi:uncharacterized protein YbaP (TraB family)